MKVRAEDVYLKSINLRNDFLELRNIFMKAKKMILFLPYWMKVIRLVLLACVLPLVLCPTSCQSFCFSCQYNSSCQIKMLIPDIGYQRSFLVYYFPDNGSQESIIRCEWLNEGNNYTCYPKHGYSCKIENKSILIDIQLDLPPGNFSLQIRGKSNDAPCICSWNPKESCRLRNTSNREMASTGSSTIPTVGMPQHTTSTDRPNNVTVANGSVHTPPPAKESSPYEIIGLVAVGVMLLILIIGIVCFCKKRGLPCHKKPNNRDNNEDPTKQPLNIEPDEVKGENNSLNVCLVEPAATSKNGSTGHCSDISNSYHPSQTNSEVLQSRGGCIVELSSSSQNNIPDRGLARSNRSKKAVADVCVEQIPLKTGDTETSV